MLCQAEYEGRRGSLERMVVVLQDSLEASRTRLTQQDEETGRLHSDLQDTAEELLFWKERGAQSDERMEQVRRRMERYVCCYYVCFVYPHSIILIAAVRV